MRLQATMASSKKESHMTQEMSVQTSSGNVFADLGLKNADELLVKAYFRTILLG